MVAGRIGDFARAIGKRGSMLSASKRGSAVGMVVAKGLVCVVEAGRLGESDLGGMVA